MMGRRDMAGAVVVPLTGRIDSGNAREWEQKILAAIETAPGSPLVLDATDLVYISSAGIRVMLRAKKAVKGPMEIREASSEVFDVFSMTGVTELIDVRRRMREISVEGLEIIGTGFYGTVYRLDEDTIVKVYESPDSIELIENERAMARLAFVRGIPTAISYDIVKVGNSYGSVFELVRSKTFNDILIAEPERTDEVICDFADLMRTVHETHAGAGVLPSARAKWQGYIADIRGAGLLDDAHCDRLAALVEAVPETDTVIHGDFHMKNVMMSEGEPLLIDMDTLCAGDPVFDLQGVYVTYMQFPEDDPNNSMNFLGIPDETATRVWELTLSRYFGTDDARILAAATDRIRLVGCIRFLWMYADPSTMGDDALAEARIRHAQEHIVELLGSLDALGVRGLVQETYRLAADAPEQA